MNQEKKVTEVKPDENIKGYEEHLNDGSGELSNEELEKVAGGVENKKSQGGASIRRTN
jgi:hypothetical protein